jgi:16S rRNA (cytosine967-C5)-methyltransferase
VADDYDFVPSRSSALHSSLVPTACKIIEQADREHPADTLLRETFKRLRVFNPDETRAISNAVFTYFRWHGFLDASEDTSAQFRQAFKLAAQFERDPFSLTDDELRAKTVPDWTAGEVDASSDWFRALQRPPNLWLRAKRGQGNLLANKLNAEPRLLPDALVYAGTEDLFRTPEFHAGEFELQDISSQAVSIICAPQPGETWWDACTGEGGKLLHLSDLMENKGLIWASDRAEWRLKHLKRRAARAKAFNYRAELWNGGAKLPTKTKFHGILVDAPCSGVGTWQRKPHARWTTTLDDVKELAAVQKQLLANVAGSLKPGGKLIYSVCTLTKSETVDVVSEFEKQFPEFQPLPVSNPLKPEAPASPQVWLWPQEIGGNGMFIAAWQRH